MLTLLCSVMTWADSIGTITFGTNNVKINAASVTGDDNLGNTWTITTVGTTSFTANKDYYQVGSSKSPATSITFTTTLPESSKIKSMSAKFGGFSDTAGTVTLKVGETSVGTGNLNATNDVTVSSTSSATGTVLTVTVTDIAKGVKVYNISYTIEDDTPVTEQYSYTLETIGEGSVEFKDANNNIIEPNQKVDKDTKITPTFTPADGYEYSNWEYYTTNGAWSKVNGTEFTITKDVKFCVTFTKIQGGDDPTPGEGNSETYTFSTFTQGNDVTLEATNYTVTLHKNTGSTAPQWNGNSNEARVYAKGSVVVTSEKNIVKVVYDYTVNANNKGVSPTVDGAKGASADGTWDESTKTWTGKDTEVTLTTSGSAGNLGFKSITVYFEEESTPETPSITISAAGVATYYNSTYSYKMPKGLTGYWVSAAYGEDGIGLLELTDSYPADVVVPAGEALIIKGAAGTYELEAGTTDYKPYGDNRLKGTDEAATTTGGDVYYKLAKDPESGLGFYWGAENGAAFTNGAHKAYLALTSEEAGVSGAKGFVLNFDEATAISTVKTSVNANAAYNLAGQRVNANTKGIVIMNGKKYLNK